MFTRKWTEKEKSYLEKEYPKGTSFTVMADHLDRTEWAVKKKAYEMELPSRTRKPKSPGKKPGKTRSTRPRKASLNLLRGRESTELDWKLYYYRSMNLSIREIAEKVGI